LFIDKHDAAGAANKGIKTKGRELSPQSTRHILWLQTKQRKTNDKDYNRKGRREEQRTQRERRNLFNPVKKCG